MNEEEIPWLERFDYKSDDDEKTDVEKIDFLTMLEELEYR